MSNYSTNLTEKQWQVIKNIVEPQERSRKYFLRDILNAIFYVNYYEFLTETAEMMVTIALFQAYLKIIAAHFIKSIQLLSVKY